MIVTKETIPEMVAMLKRTRKSRHWSLEKLADKINYNFGSISIIERGERIPKLDILADICKALGYEIEVREVSQ